jgi:hypothetical protein
LVLFTGVLTNLFWFAAIGGLFSLAMGIVWLWPSHEDEHAQEVRA